MRNGADKHSHFDLVQIHTAAESVISTGSVTEAMAMLQRCPGPHVETLLVKLLTNLTALEEGAHELLHTAKQGSGSWSEFQPGESCVAMRDCLLLTLVQNFNLSAQSPKSLCKQRNIILKATWYGSEDKKSSSMSAKASLQQDLDMALTPETHNAG